MAAKRLPRYARTDSELVEFAVRVETLQIEMQNLIARIAASPHPNAVAAANEMLNECVGLSWPTHVVYRFLERPDDWETGDWGIREVRDGRQ